VLFVRKIFSAIKIPSYTVQIAFKLKVKKKSRNYKPVTDIFLCHTLFKKLFEYDKRGINNNLNKKILQ